MSYVIDWGNSQPERKDQCAKVTKVFNYEKCRQRPEFSQNTFYGRRCEECKQVRELNTVRPVGAVNEIKPKSLWPIKIVANVNQSELIANTCNQRQARENACEQVSFYSQSRRVVKHSQNVNCSQDSDENLSNTETEWPTKENCIVVIFYAVLFCFV